MSSYLLNNLAKLDKYLTDPNMIEVAINSDNSVWLLRTGDSYMTKCELTVDEKYNLQTAQYIATDQSTQLGEHKVFVSGSIKYQSRSIRAQAVITPASRLNSVLSFRLSTQLDISKINLQYLTGKPQNSKEIADKKYKKLQELIEEKPLIDVLKYCVDSRFNILVSGGTDTGKTVALRKILSLINDTDRIITIEDAAELYPTQPNLVSLISDRASAVRSPSQLLEASLRMRPDRLIVGEIRGIEAMTFLEAMNTGHGGSMSTIHAETPELAIDRLAIAAARSNVPMSFDNLKSYICNTIDIIIHSGRINGSRGITEFYSPKFG